MLQIAVILYLLTLFLIPAILLHRYEPPVAVAWILIVVFLPFVGALTYLIFGVRPAGRTSIPGWPSSKKFRRMSRRFVEKWSYLRLGPGDGIPENQRAIANLVCKTGLPPTGGNQTDYYPEPDETYELMLESMRKAKTVINLDFYIFDPDETGRRFADVLIEKASQGVEANLLYDRYGSRKLHRAKRFLKRMTDAGVRTAAFSSPSYWVWPWYLNLRNHRKILVVDGRVGFTGGLNISHLFTSKGAENVWRDAQVRIEGPGALHLQWIFASDWYLATNQEILRDEWFPRPDSRDGSVVQIQAGGPNEEIESNLLLYLTAIASARRQVLICTPYLVPGPSLLHTLQSCSLRGVDVRLLLPRLSDHTIVTLAGRSYYHDLISCGVRIYEYLPGIDHSKVMVVDDEVTIVGSANLDIRSASFSFEISAVIYSQALNARARSDFMEQLARSEEVHVRKFGRRSRAEKLKENAARLLSPLL